MCALQGFTIAHLSPSLGPSSNENSYWKPEHPPPSTIRRSTTRCPGDSSCSCLSRWTASLLMTRASPGEACCSPCASLPACPPSCWLGNVSIGWGAATAAKHRGHRCCVELLGANPMASRAADCGRHVVEPRASTNCTLPDASVRHLPSTSAFPIFRSSMLPRVIDIFLYSR
jgi:hypothetical protein